MTDLTKVKLCWRDSASRQIKQVTINVEAILRNGGNPDQDLNVVHVEGCNAASDRSKVRSDEVQVHAS